MKKTLYAQLSVHMFGPAGERWPEYGKLEKLWKAIYADRYGVDEMPAEDSVMRYHFGHSAYPRGMRRRYIQPDGLQVLQDNLGRVVATSISMARLYTIQRDVYGWMQTIDVPADDRAALNRYYIANGASYDDISTYLASVLHYVIVAS